MSNINTNSNNETRRLMEEIVLAELHVGGLGGGVQRGPSQVLVALDLGIHAVVVANVEQLGSDLLDDGFESPRDDQGPGFRVVDDVEDLPGLEPAVDRSQHEAGLAGRPDALRCVAAMDKARRRGSAPLRNRGPWPPGRPSPRPSSA